MRKIEQQMCDAIANNKDWQSGNTRVEIAFDSSCEPVSYVFLHNNHIATVTDTDVAIYDGGWRTVTTKSRLNAICSRFCVAGEGVSQRKGEWYIHKLAGMAGTSKVFAEIPFTNGYIFA
jgi:hypothetical protein